MESRSTNEREKNERRRNKFSRWRRNKISRGGQKKKTKKRRENTTGQEKIAELEFLKVYKEIVKLFGHSGVTNSNELYNIGIYLFLNKFLGVFSADELPKKIGNKYAIVNLDTKFDKKGKFNPGSHWIAVIGRPNNKLLIFDSFGRPSSKIIKKIYKDYGGQVEDTDNDVNQKFLSENCGQISMSWLKYYDMYGIKKARLI